MTNNIIAINGDYLLFERTIKLQTSESKEEGVQGIKNMQNMTY